MKLEYEGIMAAAQSPGGGYIVVMMQNDDLDFGEGQAVTSQEKFEKCAKFIDSFGPFMDKKVKVIMEDI
jgi:hypothetical protein